MTRRAFALIFILLVTLFISAFVGGGYYYFFHYRLPDDIEREFISPDKKYKLVVYRYVQVSLKKDAAQKDGPGVLVLYRLSDGTELNRQRIELVQPANKVQWYPEKVSIPSLIDWPLPP